MAFVMALQWKCEKLLGEKQQQFTETSTPQVSIIITRPLRTPARCHIHPPRRKHILNAFQAQRSHRPPNVEAGRISDAIRKILCLHFRVFP